MKKRILTFCILHFTFCITNAQPPPPPPPGSSSGTDVPIDTEAVLLLIAGAAFAVYKLQLKKSF